VREERGDIIAKNIAEGLCRWCLKIIELVTVSVLSTQTCRFS
jgi:hypothetical protein